MKLRMTILSALLMGMLVLAACGTAPSTGSTTEPTPATTEQETPVTEEATTPETSDALAGTSWVLTALNGAAPLSEGTPISAEFDTEGSVAGSAGCNRYFAGYTIADGTLSITQAGSTMMACEDAIMAQEQVFLDQFSRATSYAIDGATLTITLDDGTTLVFERAEEEVTSSNDLTGTSWILTTINGAAPLSEGAPISAEFDDEGRITGSAGCNRYFADYTVADGTLSISQAGSTRMACEEAVMAQEQAFLDQLSRATSYVIDGATLTITIDDGTTLVFGQASNALAGTSWVLTELSGAAPLSEGTPISAEFDDEGRVAGSAGCNRYFAGYTVAEGTLSITQAGSTMMACEDAIMAQEMAFLEQFSRATSYVIEGETLTITIDDGATLVFARA
ncbi:META domain-containing protein [Candidatus Chloroploca sp. M-50]|uniref:META domain-containing protein n=1 Tax=Candidatus Chloroploca mongolica TaxID=2528176 RepID=A0ABS4DBS8_9CHLR|nr:META domain-containing protein [Candidatus Chloroploca mongolica]MBP1466906.1 META domain-containing protein [Candidatus Chloroploca mongolica]